MARPLSDGSEGVGLPQTLTEAHTYRQHAVSEVQEVDTELAEIRAAHDGSEAHEVQRARLIRRKVEALGRLRWINGWIRTVAHGGTPPLAFADQNRDGAPESVTLLADTYRILLRLSLQRKLDASDEAVVDAVSKYLKDPPSH